MNKHVYTIILLVLGAVAFALSFIVTKNYQVFCSIVTYVFPTLAAIMEIVHAVNSEKETQRQLDKKIEAVDCGDDTDWPDYDFKELRENKGSNLNQIR